MADIITHEKDDLLREYKLTDNGLMLAEMGHPGSVRILSSGRYHARLLVNGEAYSFFIKQVDTDRFELISNYPDGPNKNLLSELVWHRAAEAMSAVRQGHFEAYRNRLLRKAQKQDT